MRIQVVTTAMLSFIGCTDASVNGTVNGEPVSAARDAAYQSEEIGVPFLGDFQVFSIQVSDIPDICAVTEALEATATVDCYDQCSAWFDIDSRWLGGDRYFQLSFLAVTDPARVEGELELGGLIPGENQFNGSVRTFDTSHIHDIGECVDWCEDGNPAVPSENNTFAAGSLTIDAFDPSAESTRGAFEVELADGGLDGRYNATRCDFLSVEVDFSD